MESPAPSISPVPAVQIKVEPLSPSHYTDNEPDQPLNLAQSTPVTSSTADNNTGHAIYQTSQGVPNSVNGSTSFTMPYSPEVSNYNKITDMPMTGPFTSGTAYSVTMQNNSNMYMTDKMRNDEMPSSMLFGGYGYDLHSMGLMDNGYSDENFKDSGKNGVVPRSGSKRSNLPKRYKCAMCAYKTRYKSDLNRHVRKHAVATFSCEICNMPFKTVGNVEFHKRREHAHLIQSQTGNNSMKYKCTHCSYATMYSSDLTRHVRKHYQAKFHCTTCSQPFMTSGSLVHHKRTVHGLDDVEVVMGMGGVESVNQMDVSAFSEDNEDDKASEAKGEKTNNAENEVPEGTLLKENGKMEHKFTDVNGNMSISTDNVTPEKDDGVDKESQSDDGQKETYIYEEPDKEMEEISITIDRADNEIVSMHTCQYCNKSFGRKMVLEYHLRNIHKVKNGGDGIFVEYPDDYELALDMSIQELENSTSDATPSTTPAGYNRPRHQCSFCAYATNYKSTYDRHVKKHDLECHICTVCRMPFITFGHLQRHIRDNHPDHVQPISKKEVTVDKHKCSFCPFEAESLQGLQTHCETEHNKVVGMSPQLPAPPRKMLSPAKNTLTKGTSARKKQKPVVQEDSMDDDVVFNSKPMLSWKHQRANQQLEEGVAFHPPSSGRYAKLVSDFDDFALRPFACSLCFYRSGSIEQLMKHAENHLTGCNIYPIPDTARFTSRWFEQAVNMPYNGLMPTLYSPSPQDNVTQFYDQPPGGQMYGPNEQMAGPTTAEQQTSQVYKQHYQVKQSNSGTKLTLKSIPSNEVVQVKKEKSPPKPNTAKQTSGHLVAKALQGGQNATTELENLKKLDKIIPTFSVHYRKDKTNKTRPYLCLLCRNRFRHLTLLKQHFKQCHSESQVNASRTYACNICNKVFNSPMVLQNHFDDNHSAMSESEAGVGFTEKV